MIALAFEFRAVRLRQNRTNLVLVEIADLCYRCFLGGYTQDRSALSSRQRFTVGNELKEAVQCGQSAVPRSDRGLANLFYIFQKRENLDCRETVHAEFGNGLRFLRSDEAQKQPPAVAIGQHGVMGNISLLHQPVMEERMHQLRKQNW